VRPIKHVIKGGKDLYFSASFVTYAIEGMFHVELPARDALA